MEQPSSLSASPQPPTLELAVPNVRPYVTYILFGLTIFVYLLQLAGQALNFDLITFLGIKYNDFIRAGQVWRLVTPVFLHGSILHIGFNMYALLVYGRSLESRFGHVRFTLLYFLSAFAGNVLSFILNTQPSLGASTAIFGLVAAEATFILQNRNMIANAGRRLVNLFYIVGINLLLGFTSTGIDNFGHLGGLLGGLAFTWFGGPRWKVEGVYPHFRLVDEREGQGAITGVSIVLLIFVPLAALGWIWPK
ncbi:MAG: rhomboid family intramembrane serine protease [Anaerolineales bacterium]|nr:rhomboid family intramembrane serine protease [Anaerolineales bacterium]